MVLGVFGYTVLRSYNVTARSVPGLADPNALNPAPALVKVGSAAPNFTLHDTGARALDQALGQSAK
jgi:hypothetical protein